MLRGSFAWAPLVWLAVSGGPAPSPLVAATCVQVRAEARYRNLGYDHVVYLDSKCDKDAACQVSTDVNPTVTRVAAPAKKTTEVVTFIGSPSRVFTPKVTCELLRAAP